MKYNYGKIYYKIDKSQYCEFHNAEESSKWGINRYGDWAEQYKKLQKKSSRFNSDLIYFGEALESYCGYKYREMNSLLRNQICLSFYQGPLASYVAIINALLAQIVLAPQTDKKIVVYRLVCKEMIEQLCTCNKKNSLYIEEGFLSTSLTKSACLNNAKEYRDDFLLKIYVPEGVYAVYVNSVVQRTEEELLIAPDYYLRMIEKPYIDKEINKVVYEVELVSFDL